MKLKKLRKISRRNALLLIAGFTGTAIFPSISFATNEDILPPYELWNWWISSINLE